MSTLSNVSISDWLALAVFAAGLVCLLFGPRELTLLAAFIAGYGLGRVRFGRHA